MNPRIFLKTLILVLTFSLIFIFAIGCGDEPDAVPDEPDTDPSDEPSVEDEANKLYLVKDGNVNFTFVYDRSDKNVRNTANDLEELFEKNGLTFKSAMSTDSKAVTDCEILVGSNIKYRDDFVFDEHEVGVKGYAITVKGDKVIITGGSADTIYEALTLFVEEYLGIKDGETPDLKNLSVDRSLNVIKKQTYRITSCTIDGKAANDYDLVVDIADTNAKESALVLQEYFYKYAGAWLNLYDVSKKDSVENAVFVKTVDDAGKDGYRISIDENGDVLVECAFNKSFLDGTDRFVRATLLRGSGDIAFAKDYVYTTEVYKVYYKDFGAEGDGVTDDFDAIKKTHEYANADGYTVVAEDGATYNLGAHTVSIPIKTDVIWTGAKFIIDDSTVAPNSAASRINVFQVLPSMSSQKVTTIASLSKGQTNIGVTFDQPMLIYVCDAENDDRRVYIRYGGNADSGALRQEVILVDENGNVDPSTPILFDYPEIGSMVAYPAGEESITIKGGTFITIANQAPREYTYYNRGIDVRRSNTVVMNVTHYVQGETDTGAPYSGFFATNQTNNILFNNLVLTGHKTYRLSSDASNSMGTYELSATNSNAITWKNCTQTNDINDTTYWGVMGTNLCKNLTYDGCKLSRFDAHSGMHNTTIVNSELGHQKINAIGSGYLRIEDCIVNGNNVVVLRSDYGSTWNGEVIIKNVHLKNSSSGATVFGASWYNHYFGYTCYLPQNITIDNLTLDIAGVVYIFPGLKNDIDKATIGGNQNNNPVVLPQVINVMNMKSQVIVSSNEALFKDVTVNKS